MFEVLILHLPEIDLNGRIDRACFHHLNICRVVSWVFMILPIITRTFPSQAPRRQNLPCACCVHWIYCTWHIFATFLLHLVVTKPIRLGKMRCKSCSTLWRQKCFSLLMSDFFGFKTFGVVVVNRYLTIYSVMSPSHQTPKSQLYVDDSFVSRTSIFTTQPTNWTDLSDLCCFPTDVDRFSCWIRLFLLTNIIWLRRSPFSPTSAIADAKDDLEPSVLNLTDPQNIYHFCGQKLDHEDETMLFLELKLYVVYWVEMNEGKRREEHALSSVPKKKPLLDVVFVLGFFGNMGTSNLYEFVEVFFFLGGGGRMFWVFFIFAAFKLHFHSVSFNFLVRGFPLAYWRFLHFLEIGRGLHHLAIWDEFATSASFLGIYITSGNCI